jgi:hypothetical protein
VKSLRRYGAQLIPRGMRRHVVSLSHRLLRTNGGIPWDVIEARRRALRQRRSFGPADLGALRALVSSARSVLLLRDAAATPSEARAGAISVRHDMDHDLENSVLFAEWEASVGIRSTYFVLHTDWYWGNDPDHPSRFLLRALRRIAAHGHEIGLHNNAITAALRFGGDPANHLARAVNALRREGFEISGTAAHGDDICHVAHYDNGEVFVGATAGFGAPDRVIRWQDEETGRTAETRLRPVAMADLGLSYEAKYLGPLLYLSDTGGRWSVPFEPMVERFARGDAFLHVLTHPVWWALQGEVVRPRTTSRTAADVVIGGRPPFEARPAAS